MYLYKKYNLKALPSPIISEIFEGQFIKISEIDTYYLETYTPPPPIYSIILQIVYRRTVIYTSDI